MQHEAADTEQQKVMSMLNSKVFSILQSPDDGTPIRQDLSSEGGIQYKKTESGILILNAQRPRMGDAVYASPMFRRWDEIVEERIRYYTTQKTVAGKLAHWSYDSLRRFNRRNQGEWLLDIGCGDGAQVQYLEDRATYIGIDRDLNRLEILKKNYPEATAICGDAAALPFKSGAIGHVFSSNVFEHIWYLKDAVMELYRCCSDDALSVIVVPTEGGLWNLGRRLISQPHFAKAHPQIDFEFISHVWHCNQATQVVRTLETFFEVRVKGIPLGIPSIWLNAFLEIQCLRKRAMG